MLYSRLFAWFGFFLALVFLSAFTVYAQTSLHKLSCEAPRVAFFPVADAAE